MPSIKTRTTRLNDRKFVKRGEKLMRRCLMFATGNHRYHSAADSCSRVLEDSNAAATVATSMSTTSSTGEWPRRRGQLEQLRHRNETVPPAREVANHPASRGHDVFPVTTTVV